MSVSVQRRAAHFRVRALLQASTALPLLAAPAAMAQQIMQSSAGDIVISAPTASGTPVAVELESTGGAIDARIGSVTASTVAGQRDSAVYVETLTNGAIKLVLPQVQITGAGEVLAAEAVSFAGDIDVNVGSLDASGDATAGVYAHSDSGNITMSGSNIHLRGLDADSLLEYTPDGLVGVSDSGNVTITGGTIRTDGLYGSAIVAHAGGLATVTSDNARTTGNQGTTLVAVAAGTATVNANITRQEGNNGTAILAESNGGVAIVNATDIFAGDFASGAFARGASSATLNVGTANTGGVALRGESNSGPVTMNITGDVTSRFRNAVSTSSEGATISIAQGATVTGNQGNAVIAISGRSGDVAINNAGTIAGHGTAAGGVGVTTSGAISVVSNAVMLDTTSAAVSTFVPAGLSLVSNAGKGIDVSATTTSVTGDNRSAIYASTVQSGAIKVNVGQAGNSATDRATIRLSSESGNIALAGGSVSASGSAGLGVYATSTNGNILVDLDNVTTTGLGSVNGHFAEGVLAESTNGAVTVDVANSSAQGAGASALIAFAGGNAAIISGTATTAGGNSTALYAKSNAANASVSAGTTTTTGNDMSAIGAEAAGLAKVTSANLSASGLNAGGMAVIGGSVEVQSGSLSATRYGIATLANNNGAVSIATTGDTTATGTFAIRGIGGNVAISTAAGTNTTGVTYGIFANSTGTATIAAGGTTTATGGLGTAIRADAPGAISVTANQVRVTGIGTDPGADANNMRLPQGGIVINGGDGAITLTATDTVVEGQYRYGIHAKGNGAMIVNAGNVTLASADSLAVAVRGGAGNVSVTTGNIVTTGASGAGVLGQATSGNVTIAAGTTEVRNAGLAGPFSGDAVTGISTSGRVTITSQNASSAGTDGSAVVGIGGAGVSLTSNVASTTGAGGVAVYASSSAGDTNVVANTTTTTASDTIGVRAISQTGHASATINNLSATGATNALGVRVDGAKSASLQVTGTVTATGGAAQVASTGGYANVVISGSLTSANQRGLFVNTQGGNITIAEGGSVKGGTNAVVLAGNTGTGVFENRGTITGGSLAAVQANVGGTIRNYGTIQGGATPAIFVSGDAASLLNDGRLVAGTNGPAVLLSGADDTVGLLRNSQVTGTIDTGAGFDVARLLFSEGQTGTGRVAQFVNAERLVVQSGNWLMDQESEFDSAIISQGARLTVTNVGHGGALDTGLVHIDGEIVLDYEDDDVINEAVTTGTGVVRFTGDGEITVTGGSSFGHTGGTSVEDGALIMTGALGGKVLIGSEGTVQLGNGGATGELTGEIVNNGTFVYARTNDYTLAGGFGGTGRLEKYGAGTLTFDGIYQFTGVTTVHAGRIAFAGALAEDTELNLNGGAFDLSQVDSGEQTIAELSGTANSQVVLGATDLVVEQTADTVFAGAITGTGGLTLDGTGELDLTGNSTYTGDTVVNGGLLSVNGTITGSDFFVNSGARLGGNGDVGDTRISGGTLAAGNSIGQMSVIGNLVFTSASTLEVEVNNLGQADRIDVTGSATLGNAKVAVLAENGRYAGRTNYTILTAQGGLNGQFGQVTSNLAFLTPSLSYSANTVALSLVRNNVSFASVGQTANQAAVGALLQSLGGGNALFEETLRLTDTAAVPGFDSLSGEFYPALSTATVESAELLRRAALARKPSGDGLYGWATGIANGSEFDANTGYTAFDVDNSGAAGGIGYAAGGLDASIGVGQLWTKAKGAGRGDGKLPFVSAQVSYAGETGLRAAAGAQLGWGESDVTRTATLGAISNSLSGNWQGDFQQFYGEVGYALGFSGLAAEPFAGLSHVKVESDAMQESGGATALTLAQSDQSVTFGTFGLRLAPPADGSAIAPRASVAWRHAWGDRTATRAIGFAGSTGTGLVSAGPIAKDAAEVSAGVRINSGQLSFDVGYDGVLSDRWDSHGARATVSFRF